MFDQTDIQMIIFLFVLFIFSPLLICAQDSVTIKANAKEDSISILPLDFEEKFEGILDEVQGKTDLSKGLDGMVIDQTLTRSGRDFYELFYNQWEAPYNTDNYTIEIKEVPGRGIGIGTRILVLINDVEIFTAPIQPNYDIIESTAKYATIVTFEYLEKERNVQLDLIEEDQMGNGIF